MSSVEEGITRKGEQTMGKPDDDFEERYRKHMLPLVQQLAAEGRMRRDDDKALLMYPEGTDVEGTKTMIYCRECLVLIEVRHRSPFSQLKLKFSYNLGFFK
ncbi:MAG: hypothetical protein NT039_02275 [Candidatus Berkelbacteria bacterium]|nr:hypothetical protein [Candidatus Berkelbacteria bacterium]